MQILYGVVGEGMGHATRSRVIVRHLADAGHELLITVSGRAHAFFRDAFSDDDNVRVQEIHGLTFAMADGEIQKRKTLWKNLEDAPRKVAHNVATFARTVRSFPADVVFSDFESWAYLFARSNNLPVISIDNMQVMNRCALPADITDLADEPFRPARFLVKSKLPGAYHYLITSFFFPPVAKPRTTLVPPILRPAVLDAQAQPKDHILVYQTGAAGGDLLEALQRLPGTYRVYGSGREGGEGNVTYCGFSEQGFIDDLASARAVVGNAGFSLMSEAVHLGVPMLAIPVRGQFEQTLNARFLDRLGYGRAAAELNESELADFITNIDAHRAALASFPRQNNDATLACVDELLRDIARGEVRPDILETTPFALNAPHLPNA